MNLICLIVFVELCLFLWICSRANDLLIGLSEIDHLFISQPKRICSNVEIYVDQVNQHKYFPIFTFDRTQTAITANTSTHPRN